MEIPTYAERIYILSRASKLQPMASHSIALPLLPQLPSILGAKEMYQYTHKELDIVSEPILVKQTLVQHRQNTSREPATVMSQCTTNSYWIMTLINPKCIGEPGLCSRSDAPQQTSNRQGTGTAN